MVPSQSAVLHAVRQPHRHIAGQCCPFCGQDIPDDKVEEIGGRIAAREQERLSGAMNRLREQYEREKAEAEAKAKVELEQAKRGAAGDAERLRAEMAAREAAAYEDARKVAEEEARAKYDAAEAARKEHEADLLARITQANEAVSTAEEEKAGLAEKLERINAENAAAIAMLAREAAEREEALRISVAARETALREEVGKKAEEDAQAKYEAAEAARKEREAA